MKFKNFSKIFVFVCSVKMWAIEPSNPSKVRVYGPGIEKGVKTNQPTHFTVDCRGAGSGKFTFN
jgi:hypothetical protein